MRLNRFALKFAETVGKRLKGIFQCGLTPHKLALTICLGIAVGILPIFWGTTLICAALAFCLRLNQAAIQAVNYMAYPLQLALFFPFYRLGEKVFPWEKPLSPEMASGGLHGGFTATITHLGGTALKAVAAWLITAPPATILIYLLLLAIFKKKYRRQLLRKQSGEGDLPASEPLQVV